MNIDFSQLSPGFLQNLLSGGSTLGTSPIFTNPKSGFELDKQNRVKVDPLTGMKIKGKDRRNVKNILRNPFQILPGMSLNMQVPDTLGSANLGSILANVKRLGGGQ